MLAVPNTEATNAKNAVSSQEGSRVEGSGIPIINARVRIPHTMSPAFAVRWVLTLLRAHLGGVGRPLFSWIRAQLCRHSMKSSTRARSHPGPKLTGDSVTFRSGDEDYDVSTESPMPGEGGSPPIGAFGSPSLKGRSQTTQPKTSKPAATRP